MTSLHPILANGLFDSPLVVIIILVVSALANYLSKRRAGNEAEEEEAPPRPHRPPTPNPQARPDWQEMLERALERKLGNQQTPPPVPPTPRTRPSPPPVPVFQFDREVEEESAGANKLSELMARSSRVAHPALSAKPVVDTPMAVVQRPPKNPSPLVATLRRRETAREAFAASVVFGPPKGLEP